MSPVRWPHDIKPRLSARSPHLGVSHMEPARRLTELLQAGAHSAGEGDRGSADAHSTPAPAKRGASIASAALIQVRGLLGTPPHKNPWSRPCPHCLFSSWHCRHLTYYTFLFRACHRLGTHQVLNKDMNRTIHFSLR